MAFLSFLQPLSDSIHQPQDTISALFHGLMHSLLGIKERSLNVTVSATGLPLGLLILFTQHQL